MSRVLYRTRESVEQNQGLASSKAQNTVVFVKCGFFATINLQKPSGTQFCEFHHRQTFGKKTTPEMEPSTAFQAGRAARATKRVLGDFRLTPWISSIFIGRTASRSKRTCISNRFLRRFCS